MKDLQITAKELKEGKVFHFNNENSLTIETADNLVTAEVSFEERGPLHSWATGFKIDFNGVRIYSSKTFPALQKRLSKLIDKWHLELTEEQE